MKRLIAIVLAVTLLGIGSGIALAQDATSPFPYCTDTPEYCQVKVAQVPFPWQFWAVETEVLDDGTIVTNVIDRIRISPTWQLNPPIGLPSGEGDVFVSRQIAIAPTQVPLEELVWDFERDEPLSEDTNRKYGLDWERIDPEGQPAPVKEGEDLDLPINVTADDGAVLVAYEVMADAGGAGPVVAHIINEAVLEPAEDPGADDPVVRFVEIMVNFDVHNDTEFNVDNFELDFLGLDFTCDDVLWALGFVVGTGELWGANEDNPLVVRPIEVTLKDGTVATGTEVKWIQPDRPLEPSEWLHGGLKFELDDLITGVNATVQGYWTVTVPCEGRMTGGGSVFSDDYGRVTHGFELHCNAGQDPNNLEVNWGKGKKGANRFHLTDLIWSWCRDNPDIDEKPPVAGLDTYIGFGKGRFNGVDGATIRFVFTDEGEPGKNDKAGIVIWDADGNQVLAVKGSLKNGNHQAHPN